MRKLFILILIIFIASCSNDENSNPGALLPPETQTGANTFGCLIDGKILLPLSGNTSQINPLYGGRLTRGFAEFDFDYYELEIIDHKSTPRASLFFHMHNAPANGLGTFTINESNGLTSIDGLEHHYIHCNIFNSESNSYQRYISFQNSGNFTISRLTPSTGSGTIISGTFNCKLRNINDPTDVIEITDGRFDINSLTIKTTYFP
jgi:hypothetical protein